MGKEVEDGVHVSISVKKDDVTSHSYSGTTINKETSPYAKILMFTYLFSASVLMSVRREIVSQNDKKPPRVGMMVNGVFLSLSGVTLCFTLLVTGLLVCAKYFEFSWMKDIHYTVLKCIGYCSTVLSPFLLVMVLYIPVKLNWIGFLLACVIIGTVIACFYTPYDVQKFNQEKIYSIAFSGSLLVPPLYVLVIFLPHNLNWIVWTVYALISLLDMLWISLSWSSC